MGTSREDAFTTIRIRRTIRNLLERMALPREALWETIDRIVRGHAAARIDEKGDESIEEIQPSD
jgi:hypothetical protein